MTKNEVLIIRKVNLTMEEMDKYSTIKKLTETAGNKKRAAIALNCSVRHINTMIKGYKESGKEFFIHGNRGESPHIPLMLIQSS